MIEHLLFGTNTTTPKRLAILLPLKDLKVDLITKHYITTLIGLGIDPNEIVAFSLEFNQNNKIGVIAARKYLDKLKPILDNIGINTLMCCDASYFKALTKVTQVDPHLSYCMDTMYPEQKVFYCPNYAGLFHNPSLIQKIKLGINGTAAYLRGNGPIFNGNTVVNAIYPKTLQEIKNALLTLLTHKKLTCDIETYSLKVNEAHLATIAFAIDKKNGYAFAVQFDTIPKDAKVIRKMLHEFFIAYAKKHGKLIFQGCTYDIKILIWELFMSSSEDITGMLHGLDVLFCNIDDTKTIAYLATNTTTGNSLRLKNLAFEFTGNYALEDIEDIAQYSLDKILEYNLIDSAATWFVYDKYRPIVLAEQETVYQTVFKPSLRTIVQMELCGLPLNIGEVLNVERKLDDITRIAKEKIRKNILIINFTKLLRKQACIVANNKLKKLVKTEKEFLHVEFNPNSNTQLQLLLYQELDLPIINTTKGGNPSTDAKTLLALIEHEKKVKTPRTNAITLIKSLMDLAEAQTILNTFIPAFKEYSVDRNGWRYLLGCFNLGGTKSGRLSSSNPNLHNIPSTGTDYAEMVKSCFQAPPCAPNDPYGWLFIGADYISLEDKISALLTKDPNKMAIFLDGYDGHCLRAYSYFGKKMPDITSELESALEGPERVAVINSIADRYPDLRQESKSPTFALTYLGTWKTLVKNFGFTKTEAIKIENEYHKLYSVSDKWVQEQITQASVQGYVKLAFGLKLRTPILPQVILSSYRTLPYEAYQEVKTAGNALGQSYGLLNSYSANAFMTRVWDHPKYREWILPGAQIHDNQLYMVRNHLGCVKWVNDNLINCMEWANLEPIKHDQIKLGGKLEIYYPNWNNRIIIPNNASLKQIKEILHARK